jgi:hypothetical protein
MTIRAQTGPGAKTGREEHRKPPRDFWVHVRGRRATDFERVLGTHVVPVTSPAPHLARLPGFDERRAVYLLDLDWVREQGRWDQLVAFICERFGQEPEFVEANLDELGMPILESDTTLRIDNPQRWMG